MFESRTKDIPSELLDMNTTYNLAYLLQIVANRYALHAFLKISVCECISFH